MRTLKLGLFVAIFVATFSGAGFAQSTMPHHLCLSDAELDQVLIPFSLHKLDAMLGTCMRKYPNLERKGNEAYSEFNSKYAADIRKSASSAIQAFASHGIVALEAKHLLQEVRKVAIDIATAYDEKQCNNIVSFMELLLASDTFAQVRTMAHVDFQSARESIPACVPKPPAGPSASLEEEIKAHNAKMLENTKKRCLSSSIGVDPLNDAIFDEKCRSLSIKRE